MELKDGTGSSKKAQVNSEHKLMTDAINREHSAQAVIKGDGYNVNTGAVTLTSANESAVGFFKYTGSKICIIKEIIVILGSSTGGSGVGTIKILRNPDAGTIIDNATSVDTAVNRDFSSSKSLPGLAYKGAEGYTLTGGSTFGTSARSSFTEPVVFDAEIICLRKDNTIGITYTPPSGNTSQNIIIAGVIYEDLDIV